MLSLLEYDFMQRALIAGIFIGIVAPLIGIFLLVRRYALIGDTLSHASLAGVAMGVLLGIHPIIAAAGTAIIAALGIERLRLSGRFSGEAVLALFLSGSLAFAVVALSAVNSFNTGLLTYLFGSITTVSTFDVALVVTLTIAVLALIILFYDKFFLVSLDEDIATAQGIHTVSWNLLLAGLTALTVAVAMQVVGALLIGALMIIPVMAATQLGYSFKVTTFIAILISVASVLIGLVSSYYFDLATGGVIVLTTVGFFLLSFLVRRG